MPWWAWLLLVWINSLIILVGVIWLGEGKVGQLQDVVDAIVGQLSKVRDEIVGELEKVQASVAAAGVVEEVDLSGLQAIADALDAIVPDAADEAEVEVEYEGLDEFVAVEEDESVEADK